MTSHYSLSALLLSAVFATASQASIISTLDEGAGKTAFDGNIAVNLLRNGQSTLGSMIVDKPGQFPGTFPSSGLNDGSAADNSNLSYWATKTNGTPETGWMPVTITFDLTGSATGYDITGIQSIAGWNDSNLSAQSFQLLLSVNGGGFADYGTFTNTTEINGGNNATFTSLTDSTGTIASGVTGIQFIFLDPDPDRLFQGGDGGTVIHELQAFGTPTAVPEPQTWALAVIGLAMVTAISRRRRKGA